MSNVSPLLPKLTFNRRFIHAFLDEAAPCFALGMVEEGMEQYAVLALRPGVAIPNDIADQGFEFGHSLLGDADYELIQFAFEFAGFATYTVVVNPNNPLVQAVVRSMVEHGSYFIMAIDQDAHVITFRADLGGDDLIGLTDNYDRFLHSSTTEAQYRKVLAQFTSLARATARILNWVCRDDISFLDLSKDRLEAEPTPPLKPELPKRSVSHERVEAPPTPTWQPLSMLSHIAKDIDQELEGVNELYASFIDGRDDRVIFDDATLQRTVRLCNEQLALSPVYREQLTRWRAASPSRAQRVELDRLAAQLDQHEAVVGDMLDLMNEMEPDTIDAILRTEDGELGLDIVEGRRALPGGEPKSDELRILEQCAIANVLDAIGHDLPRRTTPLELLVEIAPQMPLFQRLTDICNEAELNALCDGRPGLYRFADTMQQIAAGIQSGAIIEPAKMNLNQAAYFTGSC